ncbi:helix-turn-helix domain-containing protein, partial [Pseudomonas sp. OF001]|uniref:helix-turn-helix domain-containing protein n=1 Tax=Pseudomonas sp. OF001 TaxID=2772300 RepID=UPI0019196DBE
MSYYELSIEERSNIQVGLLRGMSQRAIARMLNRSPSTICREIRRNRSAQGEYATQHAQRAMRERRMSCRPRQKLVPGNELFELVVHLLRKRFSPE